MYHHLDTTKKPLIGRIIESVTRTSESSVLVGFQDNTKVSIEVEGDCCSSSIFYEIVVPYGITGAKLLDIQEKSWDSCISAGDVDSEEVALRKVKEAGFDFYPDSQSVWNVVLVTDRGNIILRHINFSNGYYDGYTTYIES